MKSVINKTIVETQYPYLGICIIKGSDTRTGYRHTSGSTRIVLFTKPKTGTIIYVEGESKNSLHKMGYFSDAWSEESFKRYNDKVTLSN